HYDENMSGIFFRELGIAAPQHNLHVGSGKHGEQTAKMLQGIEQILCDVKPDWMLVYGDTNSTIAGALAAAKLHIPVAHVEAGLRSFNRRMPEEVNRILTDHASDLLLAPTQTAVAHLQNEGIADEKIRCVGDVMYDAVLYFREQAGAQSTIVEQLGLADKQYVLATIHRAENTDCPERLSAIFDGFAQLSHDVPVVLPLHPRTRQKLQSYGLFDQVAALLTLIEPVGYPDMIALQSQADLVVTDSGGVQKEAFFCGVPCLTLRDETEWVELVQLGWNQLVSPESPAVVREVIVEALQQAEPPTCEVNPFGNGQAGGEIVGALSDAHDHSAIPAGQISLAS
ncbi:MAG: non-hydrolyzing UDP-N-acetylglucosamine 2-epimerase, partial [Bythopirellula sp.]